MKRKWDWLEQRIIDCGYTRLEFAKAIDLDPARLSEMITNRLINGGVIRKIPLRKIPIFAEKLKIEPTSLNNYNDDIIDYVIFIDNKKSNKTLFKTSFIIKKLYVFCKIHFTEICLFIIAISLFKLAFLSKVVKRLY